MAHTVLVTGGNRGIGRSIALAFLAGGHRVVIGSRTGAVPDDLVAAGALAVPCDVRDTASVDQAFAKAEELLEESIEITVANAGITKDGLLIRMSDTDIEEVLDTNLTGAIRVARRAAKSMVRKRFGRIVLVSSVVGMLGSAGQVNYAASKAGLVGVARSLARELGSRSITVNVVAPGFVITDMTGSLTTEQRDAIITQIPLGRYATPEEVAGVVAFLASDEAAYVTGALIPVDGGLGMGH